MPGPHPLTPELMTTVFSVHNVSGPVDPVLIIFGPAELLAVILVPVGVSVVIILDGFPLGVGVLPDAYLPRIGEDMVEGGPVRVVSGGLSFGETRPPFHSALKARVAVFRGSVGRRISSEPHQITPTMNGGGGSRLPLVQPTSLRHGCHVRFGVHLMVSIVKCP